MGFKDDLTDVLYAIRKGEPVDQALRAHRLIGLNYLYQPVNIDVSKLNGDMRAGLEKAYEAQLTDQSDVVQGAVKGVYNAAVEQAADFHNKYGNRLDAINKTPPAGDPNDPNALPPISPDDKIRAIKDVVRSYDKNFADYRQEVLKEFDEATKEGSDFRKNLALENVTNEQVNKHIADMRANIEKSLDEQNKAFRDACSKAVDQQASAQAQYIAQLNVVQMNKHQGKQYDVPVGAAAQEAIVGKMDEKLDQKSLYKAPGGDLTVSRNKDNRITSVSFNPDSKENMTAAIQMWRTDPANVNGHLNLTIKRGPGTGNALGDLIQDILHFVRCRNAFKAAIESGVDPSKLTINGESYQPVRWDTSLKNQIKKLEEDRAQEKEIFLGQDIKATDDALIKCRGTDDVLADVDTVLKGKTGEALKAEVEKLLGQVDNESGLTQHQMANLQRALDSDELSSSEVKNYLADDKPIANALNKHGDALDKMKTAVTDNMDDGSDKDNLLKRIDKAQDRWVKAYDQREDMAKDVDSKLAVKPAGPGASG